MFTEPPILAISRLLHKWKDETDWLDGRINKLMFDVNILSKQEKPKRKFSLAYVSRVYRRLRLYYIGLRLAFKRSLYFNEEELKLFNFLHRLERQHTEGVRMYYNNEVYYRDKIALLRKYAPREVLDNIGLLEEERRIKFGK